MDFLKYGLFIGLVAALFAPALSQTVIIAEQDFNSVDWDLRTIDFVDRFDVGSEDNILTNEGAFHMGDGLNFQCYWSSTRGVVGAPGNITNGTVGISIDGSDENSPGRSANGEDWRASVEQFFRIRKPTGQLDMVFDAVDVSRYVNVSLSFNYWVRNTTFEVGDTLGATISGNVAQLELLELDADVLSATSGWNNVSFEIEDPMDIQELGTDWVLTISTDTDQRAENLIIDDVVVEGELRSYEGEIYITEIMYDPPGNEEVLEYIELYNASDHDIDLEGFYFSQGITHTFESGAVIREGEYLTLAKSSADILSEFGVTAIEWTSGDLDDIGETIELYDWADQYVHSVDYHISDHNINFSDGRGLSYAAGTPGLTSEYDWYEALGGIAFGSNEVYGTPGAANFVVWEGSQSDNWFDRENWEGLTVPTIDSDVFIPEESLVDHSPRIDLYVRLSTLIVDPDGTLTIDGFPVMVDYYTAGNIALVSGGEIVFNLAANAGDLVINEIMYQMPLVDDPLEYIEIHNTTDRLIDVSGFHLTSEISHTFDERTRIYSGEYLVVAKNEDEIIDHYGVPAIQWDDGDLDDTSGTIMLTDEDGDRIDRVTYSSESPWPAVGGTGTSLSLANSSSDNSDGSNWFVSYGDGKDYDGIRIYGTPYEANFEVWDGSESDDWFDNDNWEDGTAPTGRMASVFIPDASTLTHTPIVDSYVRLSDINIDPAGALTIDDATLITDYYNELGTVTTQNNGAFVVDQEVTNGDLIITEIMYHITGVADELEYVELYNTTGATIDLSGFTFEDAFNHVFVDGSTIDPGEYLVLARRPGTFATHYGISATGWSGTLDDIRGTILLLDDAGEQILEFTYDSGGDWPTITDAGASIAIADIDADINDGTNWFLGLGEGKVYEDVMVYGTPGAPNFEIWDGSESTDWLDDDNWEDGSAPSLATENVFIPDVSVLAYAPAVGSTQLMVLVIEEGGTLTITGELQAELVDNEGSIQVMASSGSILCTGLVGLIACRQGDGTETVIDDVDPEIVTQNLTLSLDAAGNGILTTPEVDDGSTDNFGIDALSLDRTAFDCSDIGDNTVTLTATDAAGNEASGTATVTVVDDTAPIPVTQNITVSLDASGSASIAASDIDYGSSDNCGIDELSLDASTFGCGDLGVNTVTLTATDPSGNTASATATVSVIDDLAPSVVTQDITVHLDGSGSATIVALDVDNGSSDNCGIATLSLDQSTFICADLGINTITLTATDASGNTSLETATVTVLDDLAPSVLTQDLTVSLDAAGSATVTAFDIDNGSSDNCGVTLNLDQTTFGCDDLGVNTVTLTAIDVSGNMASTTATLTVVDDSAPSVLTQDITVNLDASGNAAIEVSDVDNGSSDNCGIASLSLDHSSFSCSNTGTNAVTLTAMDASGNTSSATATVTVVDDSAPSVLTQDITLSLDASGNATITASEVDNGSTDNCAIGNLSLDQNTFGCEHLGENTVTLSVTDASGNVSSGTATVTVIDDRAPSVVAQDITVSIDAGGSVTIAASDIDDGSTDNCAIDNLSLDQTTFDCGDIGEHTVTLTATDASGNAASSAVTVTVVDSEVPTVMAQDITVSLDASGSATIVASDVDNGSSDNCGIVTLSLDQTAFSCDDLGTNTLTLTATDDSGNVSSGTATVTVIDDLAPTVSTRDIVVSLNAEGSVSITSSEIDGGSTDNCGIASSTLDIAVFDGSNVGVNTVQLMVTDVNGNQSIGSASVEVLAFDPDNQSPSLSDQMFDLDENSANGTIIGTVIASDPDGDELTYSITSGNTSNAFSLAASTGELTVSDPAILDFEVTSSFTLVIEVSDGALSASATVTINLNDVNENQSPIIEDQIFTISEVIEQGAIVGQVQASDPDGDRLSYQIADGNDDGVFAIEEASGELVIAENSTINFGRTPEYNLRVVVSDGAVESFAFASIEVEPTDKVVALVHSAGGSVILYPNPARDKVRLENLRIDRVRSMSVVDLAGSEVKKLIGSFDEIDIRDLPAGIYQLVITQSDGLIRLKFVKR